MEYYKPEVEKLVETTNCSLLMLIAKIRSLDLMVEFVEKIRKIDFAIYFRTW